MWLFNHFLELAPKRRPLISLLDGHSLHFNIDMIKMAAERASSYSVPPQHPCLSTTGQNMLSPLKQYWRQQCTQYPEESLQKTHKVLFFSAGPQSMVPSHDTMKCCCRVQGHMDFPFNRDAIKLPPKSDCQNARKSKTTEKGSSTFLPLFSPSRSRAELRIAVTLQPSVDSAWRRLQK